MKKLFFLGILMYASGLMKAQDTIVKRSGEKLIVHLTEVNPEDIRYTRFDYQNGPLFTLPKQEIAYIMYSNGIKESFENYTPSLRALGSKGPDLSMQVSGNKYYFKGLMIEETDMLAVAAKLKDKKINLMIKKVGDLEFIQKACTIGGIALFVGGLYVYSKNRPYRGGRRRASAGPTTAQEQGQVSGEVLMLAGLASEVLSISYKISRTRHAHLLVGAYNQLIIQ
jgi:hypothetical protein